MPCRTIGLRTQGLPTAPGGGTWMYLGFSAGYPAVPGAGGSSIGTLTGDNPNVDFESFIVGFYHFKYSVMIDDCPAMETIVIRVKNKGTAGTGSTLNICASNNSLLTLANYVSGESAGGTWTVSGNSEDAPGAAFNAGAGTFNMALISAAGSYAFDYTVTLMPEPGFENVYCINCISISTVYINVSDACDPGSSNIINITSSTGSINLFDQLGGSPDIGGTWAQILGSSASLSGGYLGTVNLNTNLGCEWQFQYTCPGPVGCTSTAIVTVRKNISFAVTIVQISDFIQSSITGCSGGTITRQWQHLIGGVWTNIVGATGATYNTPSPNVFYRLLAYCDGCLKTSDSVQYVIDCECNAPSVGFAFNGGTNCLTITPTGTTCGNEIDDDIEWRYAGTGSYVPYTAPICGCDIRQYLDVTTSCSHNTNNLNLGFSAASFCTGSGISIDRVFIKFGNGTFEINAGTYTSFFETISKADMVNLYNRQIEIIVRLNMGSSQYLFQRINYYYSGPANSTGSCSQVTITKLNSPQKIRSIQARRTVSYSDGCPPDQFTDTYSVNNCDNVWGYITTGTQGSTPVVVATVFNCSSPTYAWYKDGVLLTGETGPIVSRTTYGEGFYQVIFGCSDGCNSTATLQTNPCALSLSLTYNSGTNTYTATASGCVGNRTWYWEKMVGSSWITQQTTTNTSTTSTFSPSSSGEYRIRVVCAADSCQNQLPFTHSESCNPTVTITESGGVLTANPLNCPGPIAYAWDLWNGSTWVAIGGATSVTYTPTMSGLYRVRITCANGCPASAQYAFTLPCTVSVSVTGPVSGQYTGTVTNCSGSKNYFWERWNVGTSSWNIENSGTSTSDTFTYTPTISGLYRFRVVCVSNGCEAFQTFTHETTCAANVEIIQSGSTLTANVTGCVGTVFYSWYWRATPGSGPWGSVISSASSINANTWGAGEFKLDILCSGCPDSDTHVYIPCTNAVTLNCSSTPFVASGSGCSGTVTWEWYYSPTGTGWTLIPGATSNTLNPTNGTGWYRVVRKCNGICSIAAECYYAPACAVVATLTTANDKCDWNLKTLTGSTTGVELYNGGSIVVSGSWNMAVAGDRTLFKNAIEAWLTSSGNGGLVTILHDSKGDTTVRVACTKSAPERIIFLNPDANTPGNNITAWFGKCGRSCAYTFTIPSVVVQGIYIGEHLFLPALNPFTSSAAFTTAFNTFMSTNGYTGSVAINSGPGTVVITTTAAVGGMNTPAHTPLWKSASRSGCGSPVRIFPTISLGFTGCVGTQIITWEYRANSGSAWSTIQSGGLTFSTCQVGQYRVIGSCGACAFTSNIITVV